MVISAKAGSRHVQVHMLAFPSSQASCPEDQGSIFASDQTNLPCTRIGDPSRVVKGSSEEQYLFKYRQRLILVSDRSMLEIQSFTVPYTDLHDLPKSVRLLEPHAVDHSPMTCLRVLRDECGQQILFMRCRCRVHMHDVRFARGLSTNHHDKRLMTGRAAARWI